MRASSGQVLSTMTLADMKEFTLLKDMFKARYFAAFFESRMLIGGEPEEIQSEKLRWLLWSCRWLDLMKFMGLILIDIYRIRIAR